MLSIIVVGLTLLIVSVYAQFDIPEPEVVFYEPRGFRVSIPADPDIKLFAFHGRKNEQLQGTDAGTWNVDVTRATDGKLVFEDSTTKFSRGDYLSYWVHVVLHSGQGYNRLDLREEAKDFIPRTQNSFQSDWSSTEATMLSIAVVGLTLLIASSVYAQFDIPEPEVVFYEPRGFRVSIPADPDIKLFAFHGRKNEQLQGTDAGTWNVDVTRATDGKLVFEDSTTKFTRGDFLSYWIHVVLHSGQGYNRLDLREEAKDFVPRTQNSFQSPSPIGYEVPTPEVKVFSRGFEVSIPEEEGITLFAFHGQLNQPFTGLQAGQWATDITRPTEGRFRFTERSTRLKPGDIL
uniref:Putative beta-13-glucan-binding protein nasonia vitripennis n=1 Tax=Lutzomyia longipalpis TaxID=7200 RepID=A0A1B0CDG3_LUTLO